MRLPSYKHLALIALGTDAPKHKIDRGRTFLNRRLRSIKNENSPGSTRAQRKGFHYGTFVRRCLVIEHLALFPSFMGWPRRDQLYWTFGLRLVRRPGRFHRSLCVRCVRIEYGDVRVGFRWLQDDQILTTRNRPSRGNSEVCTAWCGMRRIC